MRTDLEQISKQVEIIASLPTFLFYMGRRETILGAAVSLQLSAQPEFFDRAGPSDSRLCFLQAEEGEQGPRTLLLVL